MLVLGFVQYLAVRLADQQQVIANLATVDSEQRLGKTLLRLAHAHGKKEPHNIRIELRITHEELSEMAGTTRPRISVFMQRFRNWGLIETNADHFLIIKEKKLRAYWRRSLSSLCSPPAPPPFFSRWSNIGQQFLRGGSIIKSNPTGLPRASMACSSGA